MRQAARAKSGIVAVELALTLPVIMIFFMAGTWMLVNGLGIFNATQTLCENVESALYEYDPGISLTCEVERDPKMQWPL